MALRGRLVARRTAGAGQVAPIAPHSTGRARAWPMAARSFVPLALAAILLAAAALRLIGIAYDHPYILDWDEQTEFDSATRMMAAHSLDPHFYAHGPLLIYIEALWLLPYVALRALRGLPAVPSVTYYESYLAATSDPSMPPYGRLIFVAIGVATVWLAFLVGRRLAGPWVGLLAAALLALSPLHAYESHFFLPDAPTSTFALLTLLFTLRHMQRPDVEQRSSPPGARPSPAPPPLRAGHHPSSRIGAADPPPLSRARERPARPSAQPRGWSERSVGWAVGAERRETNPHGTGGEGRKLFGADRDLALAAVMAALGAAIKYNAVALLLLPLLAAYLERRRSPEPWPLRCARLCLLAGVVFLAVTPPALFNTIPFLHEALYNVKHYARYGGGGSGASITWYAQYLTEREGLLVLPLAVVGLTIVARRARYGGRDARDGRIAMLLLAMVVSYYLLLGVQKAHYARNLLVVLPLLSVACAWTLVRLAHLRRPPVLGPAAALLLGVVVLRALGQGSVDQARGFTYTPAPLVVQSWLRAHLPPGAVVLADGYTVPPVDRPDVTTLFSPEGVTRLPPDAMAARGIRYVVLSNSLWYYQADPRHLSSGGYTLVGLFAWGTIEVFAVSRDRRP